MADSESDAASSQDGSDDSRDKASTAERDAKTSKADAGPSSVAPALVQTSNDNKRKLASESVEAPKKTKPAPIKIALGVKTAAPKTVQQPLLTQPKSKAVAQAFNAEEASDEEEMPPEAKMRMRNLGRDTPTAAGPNSFGKTKQGFIDRRNLVERELKKMADSCDD